MLNRIVRKRVKSVIVAARLAADTRQWGRERHEMRRLRFWLKQRHLTNRQVIDRLVIIGEI